MNHNGGMFRFLKQLFSRTNEESINRKGLSFSYVTVILAFGIIIMLIGNFLSFQHETNENGASSSSGEQAEAAFSIKPKTKAKVIADYEERYEEQLKNALEAIAGVGDVKVVVNIDTTEMKVVEKNRTTQQQTTDETDREGGKRKVEDTSINEEVVIVRNGEKENPVVLTTKKPEIRGVLVVATGADNLQVKKWIVEAVTRVLDVPSHRVAVLPKK